MFRRIVILVALHLAITTSLPVFAEQKPESRDQADHVVTAMVEAVYSRKKTFASETHIQYVVELDVKEVARGDDAKVGKRFYVHCFQRDDSALKPGELPMAGRSGHRVIPTPGQTIKAFTRYSNKTHNGLYPEWFDVMDDVENKKK